MPSLFDEYRTLLHLLGAVVDHNIDEYGPMRPVRLGDLAEILAQAVAQVNEAEAKA